MKPTVFIAPLVVCLAAGIWLGSQHQSISELESGNDFIRKQIATHVSSSDAPANSSAPKRDKAETKKEPIDWKKTAAHFAEMQSGAATGDMRAMIRFQESVQSMTAEEIISAMDEIAAIDLPEQSRRTLEQIMLQQLIQKDPELALNRFIDRINEPDNPSTWGLDSALRQWAEKDPAKAGAWFDQQIAAGTFESKSLDGRSQQRLQFEGNFISVLLASDPAAASARLSLLPAGQQRDILTHHTPNLVKEENQLAFANLVRKQLPEKDQATAIARPVSQLFNGSPSEGFSKVDKYLGQIAATPKERATIVEAAAEAQINRMSFNKKVTGEDIDAMRDWAKTQAPASVDKATARALVGMAQNQASKSSFADAAALAVQYHESSGSDEILGTFLEGWPARNNKEQARELAGKISDEKRRGEILKNLR